MDVEVIRLSELQQGLRYLESQPLPELWKWSLVLLQLIQRTFQNLNPQKDPLYHLNSLLEVKRALVPILELKLVQVMRSQTDLPLEEQHLKNHKTLA
jgi:hypothetical protein